MRPDQRTKMASDIYTIFADFFGPDYVCLKDIKECDGQDYTSVLEQVEQYISEKIG